MKKAKHTSICVFAPKGKGEHYPICRVAFSSRCRSGEFLYGKLILRKGGTIEELFKIIKTIYRHFSPAKAVIQLLKRLLKEKDMTVNDAAQCVLFSIFGCMGKSSNFPTCIPLFNFDFIIMVEQEVFGNRIPVLVSVRF